MKKVTIASKLIGCAAVLAACGLAGCSADTNAPEGAVGSSSEALSLAASNPTDLSSGQTPAEERFLHASCAFTSGGTNYTAMFGGYDTSGAPVTSIYVSKKIDNTATWVTPDNTGNTVLGTALGDLQAYPIDATHCLLAGGSTTKDTTDSAIVTLVTFSLNGANPKITLTGEHALNTARSKFGMSTCTEANGNVHAILFGGGNSGAELASIEVSPTIATLAATDTWTAYSGLSGMSHARINFGLAKEPGSNYYFISGGTSGGAKDNSVEAVKFNTSCAFDKRSGISANTLSHAVTGNVAVTDSNTAGTFINAAGVYTAAGPTETLNDKADTFVVTWNAAGVAPTIGAPSSANFSLSYRPTLVTAGNSTLLIGGFNAAQSAGIATVQEFVPGSGWATTVNLNASVYGAGAAYFSGASEVVVTAGATAKSGTTYTLTDNVDGLTP